MRDSDDSERVRPGRAGLALETPCTSHGKAWRNGPYSTAVSASRPPRVVLDTNVCLDLFVFGDPACASLAANLRAGRVAGVSDATCRDEWVRVLDYPALRLGRVARARALAAFDEALGQCPADATTAAVVLPRCRDPDDQKFLELAARCAARVLVTRDNSLLRLSRRAQAVAGFVVLPPLAAVALLEQALPPV